MKKIVVLILIPVLIIIAIVFSNYVEYARMKTQVSNINKEFLAYENSKVQINTIITLMNKAIQKDENNKFKENETNSIKIYIEIKSREAVIPMEELILGEKAGIEKVSYAFSDGLFEITKVEYHEKTGQVKTIVFTAKEY